MRILFIHQNFPGQYKHLARSLRALGHDVRALTDSRNRQPDLVPTSRYQLGSIGEAARHIPQLAVSFTDRVLRAEAAAEGMAALKQDGFVPDLIVGHPGWGETLFCRDIFPASRLILQAEFYYRQDGADIGFDPEFRAAPPNPLRTRARNAAPLLAMIDADALVAPTRWQASQYPAALQGRLHVIHDGIDTDAVTPDPEASLTLKRQDLTIRAGDEIVTFVNRNLEPYRGYHAFMRALPAILAERPNARAVIVGGAGVSYGAAAPEGQSWRAIFLDEVRDRLPMDRVHFVDRVRYADFLRLMRISAAHVYLTYPFVLSWSMLEAMSAGALVVGSRTAPVEEVIADGRNGVLVDFFDTSVLAAVVSDALARPAAYRDIRVAGRASVIECYDYRRRCLPDWLALIDSVMGRSSVKHANGALTPSPRR